MTTDSLITIHTVCKMTGISKPSVYRLMKKDEFPKSVQLTKSCVRWSLSEIQAWIEEKKQMREKIN